MSTATSAICRLAQTTVWVGLPWQRKNPLTSSGITTPTARALAILTPKRPFGIKMTGVLGEHQDQILDILVRQRKAVIIKPEGTSDAEIKVKG